MTPDGTETLSDCVCPEHGFLWGECPHGCAKPPRKRAPGGGRKPGVEPPMGCHTIRFPDDLWAYCKEQGGGGDAAKHLRKLVRLDIMRTALTSDDETAP